METIAVLDFETTGEPASQGGRATEIAIALVRGGQIVDRFQSLMNAGAFITPFAEELTGITNEMIRKAPSARSVMQEAVKFVRGSSLAAHNAAFDSKFWESESRLATGDASGTFICTLLLARRIYPGAPDHKLSTLARHLRIQANGRAHRAMVDAEMAAGLLSKLQESISGKLRLAVVPHAFLARAQRIPKNDIVAKLPQLAAEMRLPRLPAADRASLRS